MTCEPQLVAAASGPGRDRTDGRVPLSPLLPRPEMPCRRHAGAEVLYPLAASVPHGAGALFLMSGLKGLASGHVRLLPCASQKCESQVCESHHATRKFAKRRYARRSARRDGRRRRDVVGLEDAKIVMSVKNPESLVKGSTVRTGIPRRRRPARPMRSGRALRLLWLLSPRASAGPLRPPFLR